MTSLCGNSHQTGLTGPLSLRRRRDLGLSRSGFLLQDNRRCRLRRGREATASLGRLGGGPWLRAALDEVLMGGGATIGSALNARLSTC